MALQTFKQDILSDLIAHEAAPYDGYSRRVINVTLTNNQVVPMGTVVFRTISSGAVDQTAAYTVMTSANATASLVATNELAVVFGDKWKAQTSFTATASAATPCVSIVRGEIQLKDHLLMSSLGITSRASAEYKALKAMLEKQGVIIEKTLDEVPFGAE
jgi:hypothetical protein